MSRPVVLRALKRLPRALRCAVAGLLAVAMVVTTLLAGQTYFYCAPMHRIAFDECCARGEADEDDTGRSVTIEETHRCCEAKTFAHGDEGRTATAPPSVPLAPLAALVPPVPHVLASVARPVIRPRLRDTRAGPPPASPLAFRVPVDVSLS